VHAVVFEVWEQGLPSLLIGHVRHFPFHLCASTPLQDRRETSETVIFFVLQRSRLEETEAPEDKIHRSFVRELEFLPINAVN